VAVCVEDGVWVTQQTVNHKYITGHLRHSFSQITGGKLVSTEKECEVDFRMLLGAGTRDLKHASVRF
jgi:hypothetical protein